jgi:hypothetical protein
LTLNAARILLVHAMIEHDLTTLKRLLETLALINDRGTRQDAAEFAFAVKDCRLELVRLLGGTLTERQLHCLRQLQYRLEMIAEGQGDSWDAVRDRARQTLDACGWSGGERTNVT